MSFVTYIPVDVLKPFVKSFVISKNKKAGSYKVLPGTSIVMGFQYSGKLSYSDEQKNVPLSTMGITGLMNTYRMFHNTDDTGTVLVMFSETGAAAFFKQPMHEIFGQSLALDDLILSSQMDVVAQQLNDAITDVEKIQVVEHFLISRLNFQAHDELVHLAVNFIKQTHGTIKIASLAQKLNISQSRFEKRFRAVVGTSPKKFAAISRLKYITDVSVSKNTLTQLGLDAGYFDQAHFIKDFKSYTGETPEQFFKK
ncbi:MAG: AraC family transcriptional regulator, partial [Bacteroidia bacterium]|nr:AraC family transcriptional regulator [Bacteroidia bacterium]